MLKKDISLLFLLYFVSTGISGIALFFIIKIFSPEIEGFVPKNASVIIGIYVVPSYFIYFFPFVTFLSSILLLGKLALENFLLAGVSLGMSAWRIGKPLFIISIFITGISYMFSIYIGPWGWKKFEKKYEEIQVESIISYGTFRTFENTSFFVERNEGNLLKNIFLSYKEERGELSLFSREGFVDGGKIVLRKGSGALYSKDKFYFFEFDEMKFPVSIFTEKIKKKFFKKSLSIKELFRFAKELKKAGYNPNPVIVEALERLIYPFNTFLFAIFSIPLGFALTERKFSFTLLLGCVIYLSFFSFYAVLKVLSNKGVVNPFIGIPFPTGFGLIIVFIRIKNKKNYLKGCEFTGS